MSFEIGLAPQRRCVFRGTHIDHRAGPSGRRWDLKFADGRRCDGRLAVLLQEFDLPVEARGDHRGSIADTIEMLDDLVLLLDGRPRHSSGAELLSCEMHDRALVAV